MCGIAGFYLRDDPSGRGPEGDREILGAMLKTLIHRGPDSSGVLCERGMSLGMRRLRIIDLEGGEQPIYSRDGRYAVTFNGEIYNHRELRAELKSRGVEFRTQCDTEVLVHLFEAHGPAMLERLNGMFAIAIADLHGRRVFLARDRLGIKPLFVARTARSWVWGSEVKALLQHPEVERRLDQAVLPDYLYFNYVPPDQSLFAGIEQLRPAEWMILDGESSQRELYWQLSYSPDESLSESDAIEGSLHLLDDAVRLRLMADVPFGAFLSGGIDSSAIVASMARHLDRPVKTFSIGFAEDSFNELPYARQVARQFETEHHELTVDPDIADILPSLVWHCEEPTADSSALPVFLVSQLARQHVTMALSGDGGDEVFAGYETYNAHGVRQRYRRLPAWLRRGVIRPLIDALPASSKKVSFDFKARRFVRGAELSADASHLYWRSIFDDDAQRDLLVHAPTSTAHSRQARWFDGAPEGDALGRMLSVDTRFYLPSDMLIKVDRMSMAHSLEARVPFLDHRLVEFVACVPSAIKFKGRVRKHLLKKGLQPVLGRELLQRKKAGFNVPINDWLRGPLREIAHDCLAPSRLSAHGLFREATVVRLLHEHDIRKADHSFQIWSLLIFQLWHDQFIAGRPSADRAPALPMV
jgi:asparagine synthase (glutamine-hydrolysing)